MPRLRSDPSNGRYILNGHTPVPMPDLLVWATWLEKADRKVKQETINGYFISTVFMGLDHDFFGSEPSTPVLFETMVFGGKNEIQERYCTWEQAERGHEEIVRRVRRWKTKGSREEVKAEKPKLRAIEL